MVRKARTIVQLGRSFRMARRRALKRLRKGLDLRWMPAATRDELHRRGPDATSRR
jgi:hypothetical protein